MSIKLAEIHAPKEPPRTSTKPNTQGEQLTTAVFSSALIPLKRLFCVNRTVSGTLWLYHPSLLPPSICPILPLPAHTDSEGISLHNDLSLHPAFCNT